MAFPPDPVVISVPPRDERRNELRVACAVAHDVGAGMSEAELVAYILEHGIPPRMKRERMRLERLERAGEDTD